MRSGCEIFRFSFNLGFLFRLPLLVYAAVIVLTPVARAADVVRHICFSRDNGVWIANLDGTGAHKITTGDDPAISPDGARVAYTQPGKGTVRHIAVLKLASSGKIVFSKLPSDNAYGPAWSPDSRRLLFRIFTGDHWRLGMTGHDGSDFQFVGDQSPGEQDFQSPAWAFDGRSIYAQDLTKIYQLDLTGKVLAEWRIAQALDTADLNSSDRFEPSADGKYLLLDADSDEEGSIKTWEGPPPAIFLFDISTGKSKQISPPKIYAWEPCWLSAEEYLFTSTTDGRHFGVYKAALSGEKSRLVVNNARSVTVSAR